jgi:hypothetical protein
MPEQKIKTVNKGISTISHLPASELWRLLDYLEKFAPEGSDDETKKRTAISQLPNFFEGMTLMQKAELEGICETRSESIYRDFVRDNPDIKVNLQGTAPEVHQSGWQVKSLALDLKMQQAEQDLANGKLTNSGKQILKAKSLSCLQNIKPCDYMIAKTNFSLKNKGKEDVGPVIDSILENSDCVKDFSVKDFLSIMLQYMTKNDVSSYGYFSLFVFQRLDCLSKDIKENGKPTEKSDIEFVEYAKKILS